VGWGGCVGGGGGRERERENRGTHETPFRPTTFSIAAHAAVNLKHKQSVPITAAHAGIMSGIIISNLQ